MKKYMVWLHEATWAYLVSVLKKTDLFYLNKKKKIFKQKYEFIWLDLITDGDKIPFKTKIIVYCTLNNEINFNPKTFV